MFYNVSLGRRLILLVSVISLTTMTVVLAVAITTLIGTVNTLQEQAKATFVKQNQTISLGLDNHIKAISDITNQVAERMTANPNQSDNLLRGMINEVMRTGDNLLIRHVNLYQPNKRPTVFDLSNANFISVQFTRTISQFDIPQNAWFLESLEDDTLVWHGPDFAYFPKDETPVFSLAKAYPDGEVQGIVWMDIPLTVVTEVIHSISVAEGITGENSPAYRLLVNSKGEVFTAYGLLEEQTEEAIMNLMMSPDLKTIMQALQQSQGEVATFHDPFKDNAPSFAIESELPQTGWKLISIFPETALPPLPYPSIVQVLLAATVGIVGLLVLVDRFTTRYVAEPLEQLSRAAQEIGAGDMRYLIGHRERGDEIGRLARALDDMKQNLAHSYEQLSGWSRTLEQRVAKRTVELEQARQQATVTANELRAVYDASLSVVNEYHLQPILQAFSQRILGLLDASYCAVWLLTPDQKRLQLVANTASMLHATVSIDQGLVGLVVQEARSIIIEDYQTWPNKLNLGTDRYIHRALCVPMLFSGKPIGAVVAGRSEASELFDDDDEKLLTLFTNMVSPAVRNAQLFVQLDAAVRAAERANEVKTRFLASVTHELRTPLNLIINNMDFMRVGVFGEVNEEQQLRLDQTIRSAEHLLYLINDLLDVSKIEAGEMQLFIQPTDLYSVLEDALDAALVLLEKDPVKGSQVRVSADIPEGLPPVPMDSRRIRQVLFNLLNNAVKFTQQGEVKLTVQRENEHVLFSVSDTGIGIPENELNKLFTAFERTERAKQLGIEGTGLGLPISRFLVQQHGGEIYVKTVVGTGSTFSFTLPLKAAITPKDQTREQIAVVLTSRTN